jgi:hypothetical protein
MKPVEFTAVILASTCGARLYPLTSSSCSNTATAESLLAAKDAVTSSSSNATTTDTFDHNDVHDQHNRENLDYVAPNSNNNNQQQQQPVDPCETFMPKHLLPLAGRPIIFHLVEHCEGIGMEQIIIAIGSEDNRLRMTQRALLSMGCCRLQEEENALSAQGGDNRNMDSTSPPSEGLQYGNSKIVIVPLPADCGGSADALRYVVNANVIKSSLSGKNHVMVLPADLVLYGHLGRTRNHDDTIKTRDKSSSSSDSMAVCADITPESASDSLLFWDALGSLANVHRREYRAGLKKGMPLAMTLLLADVGEEDENGLPLKESAKVRYFWSVYFCTINHVK